MDMRDQLIGYVEGTLTPEERLRVSRHLAESPLWQQELTNIEYIQQQLQFEMPLLGRPQQGQLDSLLPDIFEKASGFKKSRWQFPTSGGQTLFVVFAIFIVLMIAPFVLHSPEANASANFTQEVPFATNTAMSLYKSDTMEARYTVDNRDVTEEAPIVILQSQERDADLPNENSHSRYLMSASPVPAPGGTAIPSLEPSH